MASRTPRSSCRALAVGVVMTLALGLAACGGGDSSGSSSSPAGARCTAPVQEPLDPRSPQHLVPGAPEPSYQTDPPTSGAHVARPPARGVQGAPLSRPEQVRVLEGGAVLVQYRPPVAAVARRALRLLAAGDDRVVVAPHPGLPARVVATAWTWKLTCRAVDVAALRRFVAAHGGRGPGEAG